MNLEIEVARLRFCMVWDRKTFDGCDVYGAVHLVVR